MRITLPLSALILSAFCCGQSGHSKAAGANGVETSITQDTAASMVWDLPEIKAWAKYIYQKTKGASHAATAVFPETPVTINKRQYWSVNFYENQPKNYQRWQSFMVRLDGKEILVDTLRPDEYKSLQKWRTDERPLQRIRESKERGNP